MEAIFNGIQVLGPLVFVLEFGRTPEEKVEIGSKTVPKLIKKIADDLTFQHKRGVEDEQQKKDLKTEWPPSRKQRIREDDDQPPPSTERRPYFPVGGKTPSDQSLDDPCSLYVVTATQSSTAEDDDLVEDGEHIRLKQEEARRMGIKSPWRKVRSRYYAASASHVTVSTFAESDALHILRLQSLLNVLTYAEAAICSKRVRRCLSPNDESASPELLLSSPRACPPLHVSASDTSYLARLVLRVWRPAGKATSLALQDMKLELGWYEGAQARRY
eukprot:Protomagalhaensia_sp_Gyna_25__1876@NODE_1998_length_1357_cov_5_545524_g1647_i0_p1_GENE_NODE_1998_length_1357_cov_5_545524_g1647_i0NODE_1998_length_1357_cov_5_545524_g1647_i0_p1_ORF_typecomplete_len273_score44_54His_Phos_2/PF00328_22/4_5e07_NODE_1998_length_1357_cov_5_545524_g1647_i05391357